MAWLPYVCVLLVPVLVEVSMKSVIKGTGYVLVHTPDMVIENGATQTTERVVNPEGEYL